MSKHTPTPWKVVRSATCGHLRAEHNYQTDPKREFTDADIDHINATVNAIGELDVTKVSWPRSAAPARSSKGAASEQASNVHAQSLL